MEEWVVDFFTERSWSRPRRAVQMSERGASQLLSSCDAISVSLKLRPFVDLITDMPFQSCFRFAALVGAFAASPVWAEAEFTRDVRPILSGICFKCHGPDDKSRKGGLRLDLREEALKAGKSDELAIVPGKPEKSEIIRRITSTDPDEIMPPPKAKLELNAAQKKVLHDWVAAGAEYKPHWAFAAPKAVPPPINHQPSTINHPIDSFVLARLEKEGLAPSPEADRPTLARRLSLDLIGLPPTLEETDIFVKDTAPDAYERLVDRLLASPRYGERWARRWLDLARYADTNGYEKDRTRNIWPYRDWVIRAMNEDMPFDVFTTKQLAGDLLPEPTTDDLIATGFHRNTMLNEEGGIDPLEFRYAAMTDRVATTGTAWLGLTIGCAQCHTHKFDPILHREYFQFMAFLNNADEPDLDLPTAEQTTKRASNLAQAAKLLAELPNKWPVDAVKWETPRPASITTASGETPKVLEDNSALFAAPGAEKETTTIVLETSAAASDQLRLEALTDASLPATGPGRVAHGNFVLSEITITAASKAQPTLTTPVKIASARADAEQSGFPVASAFDGSGDKGWAVDVAGKKLNTPKTATFHFEKPVGYPGGTRFTVVLVQTYGQNHTLGRVRLSLSGAEGDVRSLAEQRKSAVEQAFTAWLTRERTHAVAWKTVIPTEMKSTSPLLTAQPDGSVFASGDATKYDRYELNLRDLPPGATALRLEVLPDDRLPGHGPGMAYYEGPKGDFFLSDLKLLVGDTALQFAKATASYVNEKFAAANAVDDDLQTGWSCGGRLGEAHEAVFVLDKPFASSGGAMLKLEFSRHYACPLGRFRISYTTDPRGGEAREMPGEIAALIMMPEAQLSAPQRQMLHEQFLLTAPELIAEAKTIRDLRKPPEAQTTLVLHERPAANPRPTFIHHRGEYLQTEEQVQPGVPAFLPTFPADAPRNRLGLARWLVSPENPLTARVAVNRQWQAFFGTGLVATLNDFGFQGEAPSHPELLDWLAVEFMKQGWSLKKLHRLIVTSATYRQSSHVTPALLAKDPKNRLLARGPRQRVDAEVVRDVALRASGLLSEKMYGPPVKPPQPAGVTEAAYGSPKWDASGGEDRYRRALYTFQKRSAPFATFNTFDAPSGEVCVARRDLTNTPLQSLTLLNDEAFLECAQALGARAAEQPGDDEAKAAFIFQRCTSRPPRAAETAKLLAFLRAQRERIAQGELDAKDLAGAAPSKAELNARAAWTLLARSVLNLDETITKN